MFCRKNVENGIYALWWAVSVLKVNAGQVRQFWGRAPDEYEVEGRKANAEVETEVRVKEQQEETLKCWNCDG